jgi:hypothetical protein
LVWNGNARCAYDRFHAKRAEIEIEQAGFNFTNNNNAVTTRSSMAKWSLLATNWVCTNLKRVPGLCAAAGSCRVTSVQDPSAGKEVGTKVSQVVQFVASCPGST